MNNIYFLSPPLPSHLPPHLPSFLSPPPHLSLSSTSSFSLSSTQYNAVSLSSSTPYDFTPLLTYLNSPPDSLNSSPDSLNSSEFQLAESYRAVPSYYWHSLLKSLSSSTSSSPSSISTAYNLLTWLQKHNICFSYELLYSILIHALGKSDKLYEAFLLSHSHKLTPLTYNALIGACARNDELDKALNLMSRMRQDGYPPDFVNYSLIVQSISRTSKGDDSRVLVKLFEEIEVDGIELDAQLMNDLVVAFSKVGDVDRAMSLLGVILLFSSFQMTHMRS